MARTFSREEKYGCLFCLLGLLVGLKVGAWTFAAYVDAVRAKDPSATICGLPALAALFWGMVAGGVTGAMLGMALGRFLPQPKPPRC